MGELLHQNRATETRTAAAPALSAGMSTLVRKPVESPAPRPSAASLTVLRVSLLAADCALTSGAVLWVLNGTTASGWTATALALTAVAFGAWLGWLGLTWGRTGAT